MQRKFIGFFLGIFAFLGILIFADLEPGKPEVTATLAVTALMAIWWITETIPLAVTALVPNMIGILVVVMITWLLGNSVLDIDLGAIPDWVRE